MTRPPHGTTATAARQTSAEKQAPAIAGGDITLTRHARFATPARVAALSSAPAATWQACGCCAGRKTFEQRQDCIRRFLLRGGATCSVFGKHEARLIIDRRPQPDGAYAPPQVLVLALERRSLGRQTAARERFVQAQLGEPDHAPEVGIVARLGRKA